MTEKEKRLKAIEDCRLYTIKDLEPVLGLSRFSIMRLINDGKLKANKISGAYRITEKNLRQFVNGLEQTD